MPHSSGGGSHGGGSFHSSSSYHSSSSSHTTYVDPFKRSSKPFRGCHTYYYYRPDGMHYVYTNKKIEEETTKPFSKTTKIILSVIISILLVGGLFLIKSGINYVPNKLNTSEESRLLDNANLIKNKSNTSKLLKEFKDTTGMALILETVNNENWQNYYYYLEDYAYESYLKNFDDEKCWLIVYSEPTSPDPNFNDWYWEGMQGDDTDNILTDRVAEKFGNYFQKELLKNNNFEDAFNNSLTYLMTFIMAPRTNDGRIAGGVLLSVIGLIILLVAYSHEKKIKKRGYHDSELYEFKDGQVLKTCPYCGKEFLNTGFKKCPFCDEILEEE